MALLHEIHRSSPRPLGGSAFLAPDTFFSLGTKIFNDLEELRIEGVDARAVGEVQPLIEEKIPERSRNSLQTLQLFYKEFYPRVDALGYSTRSSAILGGVLFARRAGFRRVSQGDFRRVLRADAARRGSSSPRRAGRRRSPRNRR